MTTEDRTQPIRELLGTLDGKRRPRPSQCGGALLSVDMATYREMGRRGTDWSTPEEDIPDDGSRVDARVACDAEVIGAIGRVGVPVQYATCARCHALEARAREVLAERAARLGSSR